MTRRRDGTLTQRTTAVVLAGGKGTRLDPLTRTICKPALPFGGSYRCIDFSLSNCVNSGLRNIGVATQHQPDALLAHLWSHWNRPAVGNDAIVHAWRAEERAARFGYCGTADAVYRNLTSIRDLEDSLVLVLAGDHVYKMDYRPMLEAHRARNAGVTIGCIEAPLEDACQFGVLAVADDGRIERFVEKPSSCQGLRSPAGDSVLASMGIYVFDGAFLARILHVDAARPDSGHDFGSDVLPQLIEGRCAYAYAFRSSGRVPAYWRDIGTLRAYWRAHMELLPPRPLLALTDSVWPIGRVATSPQLVSAIATTAAGGTVERSIVTASSTIAGHAQRSVLFDDVEVGRGATVAEAVVLPGAVIGPGCRLRRVIVDAGYRVADGTVVEPLRGASPPPVLSRHSAAETAGYRSLR